MKRGFEMTKITTLRYPPLAYRLKDFCAAVGISLRTYYTLREQGDAPTVTVIGGRNVIRHATAAAWLEAHEAKAA
jgi:predicted DNA-binding transcriptional regulator AlpA